ncbi:hypothetical protein MK131_09540, partial [Candidatus Poribacteria bacterium]|nr:hypothetical protein [Candidatus Poribacteria bacterium]
MNIWREDETLRKLTFHPNLGLWLLDWLALNFEFSTTIFQLKCPILPRQRISVRMWLSGRLLQKPSHFLLG